MRVSAVVLLAQFCACVAQDGAIDQSVRQGTDGPEAGTLSDILRIQDAGARDVTCADSAAGETLLVVTLNTHSFQEGADSLAKLQLIGQGLAALGADIVGLNEVMSGTFWAYDYGGAQYDGAALIQESLQASSGVPWHVVSHGFAHWESGELMSNVILSRTPILESDARSLTTTDFWPGPQEQRSVIYAATEVPSFGLVHVFVTHTWGWESVDTLPQINEVKAFMADKQRGDETLSLLLGDLNAPSTSAAYSWWTAPPAPLVDTFAVANPGQLHVSTTWSDEHRIDYILAREASWDLASWLIFIGKEEGGLVLSPVSDHKGVATLFKTRCTPAP